MNEVETEFYEGCVIHAQVKLFTWHQSFPSFHNNNNNNYNYNNK